ncbi:MAG: hypothetical protein E6G94_09170 [Alphaproteobacteria bacterium]|nr:MAG: hypothetical protein E6G94_09170 [Alphaproteobacteria bacterium]
MSYKDPSFQDRIGSSAKAKERALAQLRAKPPVDPAVAEQRAAKAAAREAAAAEKRAAKEAEREAAEAEKAEAERAAAEAKANAPNLARDLKAARDARYAARKARK